MSACGYGKGAFLALGRKLPRLVIIGSYRNLRLRASSWAALADHLKPKVRERENAKNESLSIKARELMP